MTFLFKKLKLKEHTEIEVMNAPTSFHIAFNELQVTQELKVKTNLDPNYAIGFNEQKFWCVRCPLNY
jgi:hypothetical protein